MPGMRTVARAEEINLGFQIAPMIDVVFVIMLFFVVMAGTMETEREFRTTIPRGNSFGESPDELWIKIFDDGLITVNEEEMADEQEADLVRLTQMLTLLQRDCAVRGSKVIATLETESDARYQRIMDVLNSLSKANISDVTFTVGSDE